MRSLALTAAFCVLVLGPAASFAQTAGNAPSSPNAGVPPAVAAGKSDGSTAPAGSAPAAPSPSAAPDAGSSAKPPGAADAPPIKPGSVRITTRAPEVDKWDAQRSANGTQRLFKCKPLACPDAETISFTFLKSPTRHPDPQALDKLAQVDLPKSIRAANAAREILSDGTQKIETLTSKSTTLKNYPAVINETRLSQGKMTVFLTTALIFAGPVMIRVQSTSQNRELAQKTLNQFVDVMRIEEGPPLAPGMPAPANGVEQL